MIRNEFRVSCGQYDRRCDVCWSLATCRTRIDIATDKWEWICDECLIDWITSDGIRITQPKGGAQ